MWDWNGIKNYKKHYSKEEAEEWADSYCSYLDGHWDNYRKVWVR